ILFAGLRRRIAIAGIAVVVLVLSGAWLGLKHSSGTVKPDAALTVQIAPVQIAAVPAEPESAFSQVGVPQPSGPARAASIPRRKTATSNSPPERVASSDDSIQIPMKFITDDPDIIIYWLPSDKGD